MMNYSDKIIQAQKAIREADFIVIGAGAGLSDAAGLKYMGERFTKNFEDFIRKYHFTDLYSSSFYPFETEEERWAYWAKHISLNRYETPATELYIDLLKLVQHKNYFVLTTNVESQFRKAGFNEQRIFATQGDYGLLQCARACHSKLYNNEDLVKEMTDSIHDCKIPTELVPYCPVCGGKMDVNLRKDHNFVEDKNWNLANERYSDFLKKAAVGNTVLLELGVGFNTPGIIRYPFERMIYQNQAQTLIRINKNHADGPEENRDRTISFSEEMNLVFTDLKATNNARHLEPLTCLH